eukprot:scaffold201_cov121-Isochrysis_galbana.AAC.16
MRPRGLPTLIAHLLGAPAEDGAAAQLLGSEEEQAARPMVHLNLVKLQTRPISRIVKEAAAHVERVRSINRLKPRTRGMPLVEVAVRTRRRRTAP